MATSTARHSALGHRRVFRGLHVDADRHVTIEERPLAPLGESEVRVRTEFASIKHGTDFLNLSQSSPFADETLDGATRLFVPRPESERGAFFAAGFAGNTAVGTVVEVGSGVTAFEPGDRVYGYAPACDMLTLPERRLNRLREPMTAEDAVCLDPALYAFAAVRDARACLGDTAVVFGLGACLRGALP